MKEELAQLHQRLSVLVKGELLVILYQNGLMDGTRHTIAETAKKCGVTKERVEMAIKRAYIKLKEFEK